MGVLFQAGVILCSIFLFECVQERSFTVDKIHNCFLKDGKPFRYVSGSLHYFRVPQQYWRDRMLKMKAAGLNAIQTYVEWSGHEPEPGQYNFRGDYDLIKFIQTAADVGLLVIFRPGPYICAEREFGGFPYWLLREKKNIILRSNDDVYIKYVDSWFQVLLPMVEPFLYANGGPIILVQIENEYGQFGQCDRTYMAHLRNVTRQHLGKDVVLFRTDIPYVAFYTCDKVDGVMVTADFGSGTNVENSFKQMRAIDPAGPLVVTEYYPGWMDHWGEPHANVKTEAICKTLDDILAANASVNFYMFHGGTNFGFSNGANGPPYSAQPTSYDYAAPLSEAGDPNERYFKIREVIGKYMPLPPGPTPKPSPKLEIGPLQMKFVASLFDFLPSLTRTCQGIRYGASPKTFEEMSQAFGFVIYKSVVNFIPTSPSLLQVPGVRDRGYVFVEKKFAGVLSRSQSIYNIPILVRKGQNIFILVENQGRMNSGDRDFKGIISDVTLGKNVLTDWTMFNMPMNDSDAIHNQKPRISSSNPLIPGFYSVNFTLPKDAQLADTFLNPTGWHKGVAFLNEFNLGRYWPVMGPQVTLYCPGIMFRPYPQNNTLTLFELERAPEDAKFSILFQKDPILNGTTPK